MVYVNLGIRRFSQEERLLLEPKYDRMPAPLPSAGKAKRKNSDACEMEIKGTPPPHSVKNVWPTHKRALWPAQKRALGATASCYLVPASVAKLAPVKSGRRAGVVGNVCPPVYYPTSYGNKVGTEPVAERGPTLAKRRWSANFAWVLLARKKKIYTRRNYILITAIRCALMETADVVLFKRTLNTAAD